MIVRILQAIGCASVVILAAFPIAAATQAEPIEEDTAATSSEVSDEETLLVEGLAQLRAWKLAEADELLGQVCPKFTEEAGEGTSLEDLACSARAVSLGEVKGAKDARDRADGYWWAGERARRSDKIQVARAFLELGLDRNPKDTDLWTSLGRVQRDTGDLDASTKSLRKASELDRSNSLAVYWLAANRMDQNDPAEAETLLRGIVAKDRRFGHAWYRLGELQMKKNDPQAAIKLFEKAKVGGVKDELVDARIAECRKAIVPKATR